MYTDGIDPLQIFTVFILKSETFSFWSCHHAVLCKGRRWDKKEENSERLESKLPLSTSRISPLLFTTLTLHPKPYFHRLPSTSSRLSHILKKFRFLIRGTCTYHLWYALQHKVLLRNTRRLIYSMITKGSRTTLNVSALINLLKTKRICDIKGLSPYRAVNTLHLGYKKTIF
jgi:hypothetical protein